MSNEGMAEHYRAATPFSRSPFSLPNDGADGYVGTGVRGESARRQPRPIRLRIQSMNGGRSGPFRTTADHTVS